MSVRRECDRCRKQTRAAAQINAIGLPPSWSIITITTMTERGDALVGPHSEAELCGDCTAAIRTWLAP